MKSIETTMNPQPIRFAAVGDVHGHLLRMVELVAAREHELSIRVDFVLQTGDFEPIRHETDLATMSVPQKYRQMGDFAEFFSGRQQFPWPVHFIGGNHEPYGFLDLTPEGACLAKNCHYLGRTGCVELGRLRLAGISGVYSESHYQEQRPSVTKVADTSKKLYTYFNDDDLSKLMACEKPDILLMHDWPSGIIADQDQALFGRELNSARHAAIGNDHLRTLVELLGPRLVLCGHMHRAYSSTIMLDDGSSCTVRCLPKIDAGIEAVAVFETGVDGTISELTKCPAHPLRAALDF